MATILLKFGAKVVISTTYKRGWKALFYSRLRQFAEYPIFTILQRLVQANSM